MIYTICPFANYLPISTNTGGPMAQNIGLVVHVQVGDNSLYGWFNNPNAQVSAHFWVSKTGTLEQYVPCDVEAWAEVDGNSSYLSVETEGYPTEPLTLPQMTTLARLIGWGNTAFGWPLALVDHGGRGITTHAHYPSGVPDPAWGDHACPGTLRSEQLPAVLSLATQPPTGDAVFIIEGNGDRYWFVADGTGSYWRPVPASANLTGATVIQDTNGVLLAMWKVV